MLVSWASTYEGKYHTTRPLSEKKGTVMAESVLSKLKALDAEAAKLAEERTKLLGKAKDEAMTAVQTAIEALNALGYDYRIVEGRAVPASTGRKGTRTLQVGAVCPVCKLATNPPHDARSRVHRSQAEKKPLTTDELAANHYTKL